MIKEIYLACKEIGVDLSFILAGLFGGVAMLSKPNEMSKWQKALTVFAGIGTANYMTPGFLYVSRLPEQMGYTLAFIFGLMGLKAVDMVITKWNSKFSKKNKD